MSINSMTSGLDNIIAGVNRVREIELEIHAVPLSEETLGFYNHATEQIFISDSISHIQQRFVLAHELGHALFAHNTSCNPKENNKQEQQANKYAVRLLVKKHMLKQIAYDGMTLQELCGELELPYTDIKRPEILKYIREISSNIKVA